jgi:hypothetical protein
MLRREAKRAMGAIGSLSCGRGEGIVGGNVENEELRMNLTLGYIDPGSGSIMLQVLLASCVGGVALFWGKLKALFGGKKPDQDAAEGPKDGDKPSGTA